MNMLVKVFFSMLFVLLFCTNPLLANDGYDYDPSPYWENFYSDFPPEGWILHPFHPFNTWQHVFSAADGQITHPRHYPDKFIYVSGKEDELYNEFLITAKWNIGLYYNCRIELDLACEPGFSYEDDFNFSVEISYDFEGNENPTWQTLASLDNYDEDFNCEPRLTFDKWDTHVVLHNFLKKDFRLGFRYSGKSGTGVGMDDLNIYCLGKSNDDDDDNDDDNNDNDNDDDDSPPVENADDEKKNNQNCGLTFHDPAVPLAMLMLLIGCGALLISRSRTK